MVTEDLGEDLTKGKLVEDTKNTMKTRILVTLMVALFVYPLSIYFGLGFILPSVLVALSWWLVSQTQKGH